MSTESDPIPHEQHELLDLIGYALQNYGVSTHLETVSELRIPFNDRDWLLKAGSLHVSADAPDQPMRQPAPIELQPCPFCGGSAILSQDVEWAAYFIRCRNRPCDAEGPWFGTPGSAAKAWNGRSSALTKYQQALILDTRISEELERVTAERDELRRRLAESVAAVKPLST